MNSREEYEQKAHRKLNELKSEIEKLRSRAEISEADEKIKYKEEIEKLNIIKDLFSEKMTTIKNASNSSWEEMKSDMEKLNSSVDDTLRSVISKFQ